MKEIELHNGMKTIVDDEDYEFLNRFTWTAQRGRTTWYCITTIDRECVPMHRLITKAPKGLEVDHEDHNGLNNQRSNLRIATRSQNMANARKWRSKTSSKYKGVCVRADGYITAQIYPNRRAVHLGYFPNEELAAEAYDKAAIFYFGEFARLNFPESKTRPLPVGAASAVCSQLPRPVPMACGYVVIDIAA